MVGEKPARMVCYCKWLSGKEYMGSIPGSGRSPGEGNGNPHSSFLPEKHHGQRSLAGYSHGVTKESDMTLETKQQQ